MKEVEARIEDEMSKRIREMLTLKVDVSRETKVLVGARRWDRG